MTVVRPSWLVKDRFDVGLYTNKLDEQLAFWKTQPSLSFEGAISIGGGVRQYRFDFDGAILKVNHSRHELARSETGNLLALSLFSDVVSSSSELSDPDGNSISLIAVPRGQRAHWSVEVAATSVQEFIGFYHGCVGLPLCPDEPGTVLCGTSRIRCRVRSKSGSEGRDQAIEALGLRYLTFQVDKVDRVHAQLVANGAIEHKAPATLGSTARISFIRDWSGNAIELSQRASLVGSLEQ